MTPAERRLWPHLRGQGFIPQFVMRGYILDFYSPRRRLVVELDGAPHADPTQQTHDATRDAALERLGLTVFRLPNADVLRDPLGCARELCAWSACSA
jgi:very-short-patch-repair endonuclease